MSFCKCEDFLKLNYWQYHSELHWGVVQHQVQAEVVPVTHSVSICYYPDSLVGATLRRAGRRGASFKPEIARKSPKPEKAQSPTSPNVEGSGSEHKARPKAREPKPGPCQQYCQPHLYPLYGKCNESQYKVRSKSKSKSYLPSKFCPASRRMLSG